MLNQAYTSKNLLRQLRKTEPQKHKMGRSKDDYLLHIDSRLATIDPATYSFVSLKKKKVNERKVFIVSDIIESLLLRKCNDNLKRIFSIKSNDRQDIVNKTYIMLSEPVPFYVYKLDIKSFYEQVNKNYLLKKINDNSIVSYHTKRIITNLLQSNHLKDEIGLPRGIGISATLSDLYLESFDKSINHYPSVYYSSRYVDDVIIFSFERIPDYLDFFQKMLPAPLELNKSKCQEFVVDNGKPCKHNLNFLGYNYSFENKLNEKKRIVNIKISQNKINKIKKRIILSLKDFSKNGNKELLVNRIRYLTSNFPIEKPNSDNSILYSGIYYTFMHLNDHSQLRDLDNFKNFIIHASKGNLARNLSKWPASDYQSIKKYSFHLGHTKKIKINFTQSEFKKITKAW